MFDPGSWTSQEAAFYVSSGLLVVFVILGAIGAYADEKGHKEVTNLFMGLAGAVGVMACLGYLKWGASFIF
jgi:hypothetical protein